MAEGSTSIGKITLDLEVKSDLEGQLKELSASIGRTLKNNFRTSTAKSFDGLKKSMKASMRGSTKEAQKGLGALEKLFKSRAAKIANVLKNGLGSSLRGMGKMKLPQTKPVFNNPISQAKPNTLKVAPTQARDPPTGNSAKLQADMLKTEATLNKQKASIASMMGKVAVYKQQIADIGIKWQQINTQLKAMKAATALNPTAFKDSEIQALEAKLRALDIQDAKVSESMNTLKAKIRNTAAEAKVGAAKFRQLKSDLAGLNGSLKQSAAPMNGMKNKLLSVGKSAKSARKSFGGAQRGAGGFLSTMIRWGIIFPIIQRGIMGMAQSLYTSLMTNEAFANSLNQIKTNLMVAFMPIYNAVLPAINILMRALVQLSSMLASFISGIFGTTYDASYNATQGLISAKDAMGAYGDAAGDTQKAVKDMLGLAGFDEINALNKPETDSGSKAPVLSTPMSSDMSAAAEKFKNILSQIFKPFQEAWAAEGQNTINAMKYALGTIWELVKSIGRSFIEVWTNGTGTRTLTLILQIFQDIFKIIGNIAMGLETAWNKNSTGTQIVQTLFNIFNIVLDTIRKITDATVEWSGKLDFSPLLTSVLGLLQSLEPLTQTIGDGLAWFWNNVLLPIAGWTIQTAVPTFLDLLSAAIGAVNSVITPLQPLVQWLFDSFLLPNATWTGGVIVSILKGITDALKVFSDWCLSHQETVQNIAIIIGSFVAAWGVVSLATTIGGIVSALIAFVTTGGLAAGAATVLGGAIAFLTSPVTIAIAIIGALIAVGVLLYKNWDTIKEKCAEAWTWIQEKFQAFNNFLGNVFAVDWTRHFGAFGDVINSFMHTTKGVWDSIKQIFGGIIDFIAGVFTGNWSRAWDGVVNIFGGIVNGLGAIIKTPLNAVIGLINAAISGLNRISVSIPSWVPGVGGRSFGVNIPRIPYLAKGGIVDQPTLSMVGEAGKEAVVPLENNTGWMDTLAANIAGRINTNSVEILSVLKLILKLLEKGDSGDLILMLESSVIGRIALKEINKMNRQGGINVLNT